MLLKNRQKMILNAAVREHIVTAKPVASQELNAEFGLGLSPATIRNEMLELDRLGYLEQPHTSAGRIPTNQGYRFFVDYLIDSVPLNHREKQSLNQVFTDDLSTQDFIRELTKTASKFLGVFSLGGVSGNETVVKTGFAKALEEPEFEDRENARDFGRLVDVLDEEIQQLLGGLDNVREKIFIGEENPLVETDLISMLISSWQHPRGFSGFLAVVGPKRIDYQKHISFMRYLQSF